MNNNFAELYALVVKLSARVEQLEGDLHNVQSVQARDLKPIVQSEETSLHSYKDLLNHLSQQLGFKKHGE